MYIHIRMHTYTSTDAIAINERRGQELEGEQEGYIAQFIRRKKKGEKSCNYINLNL